MTLIILVSAIGVLVMGLLVSAFRCKHAWEFVDKTEFPAPLVTAKSNGVNITWDLSSWQLEAMSKKTVVIVIRCPKCGTPKVLRETH
jgi:hypothetical protein